MLDLICFDFDIVGLIPSPSIKIFNQIIRGGKLYNIEQFSFITMFYQFDVECCIFKGD